MLDGRSKAPEPPDEIQDELLTRSINHFLHTAYSVEQIQNMPYAWLVKMQMLLKATEQNG